MKIEYEIRILDIDINEMIKKVINLHATKIGKYHQKRYVYDFCPIEKGRWIRLRTNGEKNTLTIKEIHSEGIDGTNELEITVSDFNDTNEILKKLGYSPRSYQENFRMEFELDSVKLDFDKWPMIAPFLEIEGDSKERVLAVANKLGVTKEQITTNNVDVIYKLEYGINIDKIQYLCFNDTDQEEIKILESERKI